MLSITTGDTFFSRALFAKKKCKTLFLVSREHVQSFRLGLCSDTEYETFYNVRPRVLRHKKKVKNTTSFLVPLMSLAKSCWVKFITRKSYDQVIL